MASTGCCSLPAEGAAGALVDARGLKCPLPVLKTEKHLASLPPGASLLVLATDPMARIDIALFCRRQGHACVVSEAEGTLRFAITKAAG